MRNVGRWVGAIVTAAVLAAQQLPPVKHVDPCFSPTKSLSMPTILPFGWTRAIHRGVC